MSKYERIILWVVIIILAIVTARHSEQIDWNFSNIELITKILEKVYL